MSSAPRYRVDQAQVVLAQIRTLAFRATRKGLLQPFVRALREVTDHLETDPTVWGDPLFQYSSMGLPLFQRAVSPLIVLYAVDEPRKIVYVKSIRPFPGGGLEAVP
jgi:hypothetical protein